MRGSGFAPGKFAKDLRSELAGLPKRRVKKQCFMNPRTALRLTEAGTTLESFVDDVGSRTVTALRDGKNYRSMTRKFLRLYSMRKALTEVQWTPVRKLLHLWCRVFQKLRCSFEVASLIEAGGDFLSPLDSG